MIEVINAASEFYILEALSVLVKPVFGIRSQELLLEDIKSMRERFSSNTANALFDYTVKACIGEARHSRHSLNRDSNYDNRRREYDNNTRTYTEYDKNFVLSSESHICYGKVEKYEPKSLLVELEKLFAEFHWSSGYGGKKWGLIANRVQLYGKIDDVVFCDMCFSLSHNSSPYLDKKGVDIFSVASEYGYMKLLNSKLLNDSLKLILEYASNCGKETKKLLQRANALGFLNINEKYFKIILQNSVLGSISENEVLSYQPVKWGSKIIKLNIDSNTRIGKSNRYNIDKMVEANSPLLNFVDYGIKKNMPVFIEVEGKTVKGLVEPYVFADDNVKDLVKPLYPYPSAVASVTRCNVKYKDKITEKFCPTPYYEVGDLVFVSFNSSRTSDSISHVELVSDIDLENNMVITENVDGKMTIRDLNLVLKIPVEIEEMYIETEIKSEYDEHKDDKKKLITDCLLKGTLTLSKRYRTYRFSLGTLFAFCNRVYSLKTYLGDPNMVFEAVGEVDTKMDYTKSLFSEKGHGDIVNANIEIRTITIEENSYRINNYKKGILTYEVGDELVSIDIHKECVRYVYNRNNGTRSMLVSMSID